MKALTLAVIEAAERSNWADDPAMAALIAAARAQRDAPVEVSRDAVLEEAAKAVEGKRQCPFDKDMPSNDLRPEDPCPICGDLGLITDTPSNCDSPSAIIRALKP